MTDREILILKYEKTLREYWDKYRRRSPTVRRETARNWFYFYNGLRKRVRHEQAR